MHVPVVNILSCPSRAQLYIYSQVGIDGHTYHYREGRSKYDRVVGIDTVCILHSTRRSAIMHYNGMCNSKPHFCCFFVFDTLLNRM